MTLSHTMRRPSWCSYLPKTVWTVLNERHRMCRCISSSRRQIVPTRFTTNLPLSSRFCYLCSETCLVTIKVECPDSISVWKIAIWTGHLPPIICSIFVVFIFITWRNWRLRQNDGLSRRWFFISAWIEKRFSEPRYRAATYNMDTITYYAKLI